MKKRAFLLLTMAVATITTGCTAVGPRFDKESQPTANDGRALIYVYRPDLSAIGARTAGISIDGKRVGGLKKGGYLVFKLAPGTYTLTQRWDYMLGDIGEYGKTISLQGRFDPNTVTYFRLSTAVDPSYQYGMMTLAWKLQTVSADVALGDLPSLNRVEAEMPFSDQ